MSAVMEEEIKRWTALARPSASYVVSVRWVCQPPTLTSIHSVFGSPGLPVR